MKKPLRRIDGSTQLWLLTCFVLALFMSFSLRTVAVRLFYSFYRYEDAAQAYLDCIRVFFYIGIGQKFIAWWLRIYRSSR